jgi:P4 family phage/plasmid primase-like protien
MTKNVKTLILRAIAERGMGAFKDCVFTEEHAEIVDTASVCVPVCLLGSAKPERSTAYPLSAVYRFDVEDDIEMTKLSARKMARLTPADLSVNLWGCEPRIKNKRAPELAEEASELLATMIEENAKKRLEREEAYERFNPGDDELRAVRANRAKLTRLVISSIKALGQETSDETYKWRRAIACVKNIVTLAGIELEPILEALDQFSSKSDKYAGLSDVQRTYQAVRPFGFIRYLFWMVRNDSSSRTSAALYREYCEIYKPPERACDIFRRLAFEGDLSEYNLGELLAQLLKGDVFIDDEGDGHIWNEEKRIWEFKQAKWLQREVRRLKPLAVKCLESVHAQDKRESERLSASLQKAEDDGDCDARDRAISEARTKKANLKSVIKNVKLCILRTIGGVRGMANVFTCASGFLRDDDFADSLDKNKDLFPTNDGKVVDLRTGNPRDRTREDLFSFEAPCRLASDDWSRAERFMESMFRDEDVREYMHKRLGAILSGVPMREIDIWYGCGRNGKTVLVRLMSTIMGRFSTNANRGIFIDREGFSNAAGHTSHIVPIIGKRMVTCCEIKKNDTLNSTMLKGLSGGDEISYRGAYAREEKTFVSEATCILAVNDKPRFDAEDQAIIDRMRYIPFNSRFVEENPKDGEQVADREFIDQLMSEDGLCEMFSYLVRGTVEFYRHNCILNAPESVLEAKRINVADADHLGRFLEENYERYGTDEEFKAMDRFELKGRRNKECLRFCNDWGLLAANFHRQFNRYLESEDAGSRTVSDLKREMGNRGYIYAKLGNKPRHFLGLRRLPEDDSDDEDSDEDSD